MLNRMLHIHFNIDQTELRVCASNLSPAKGDEEVFSRAETVFSVCVCVLM